MINLGSEEMYLYYIIGVLLPFIFIIFLILGNKKYDLVVFLNVFLLSFAFIEPSPSDLLFLLLILFYFKNQNLELDVIRKNSKFFIPILLFSAISIISIYYVEEYYISFKYIIISFYLIAYSLFIFLYTFKKGYKKVLTAYVASSTFSSFIGILGYFKFLPNILRYDEYRIKGFFKDPNVFGPFLVPSVIILMDIIINKNNRSNRYLYIFLIIVNSLGVLLSFSRAAWINFLISVFIYILLNIKNINFVKMVKFTLLLFIVISLMWSFIVKDEYKEFIVDRAKLQGYDSSRFLAQKTGIELIFDKVFGYGSGQYESTVVNVMNSDISAHSMYMRILLENGLVGFVLIIISFSYIVINLLLSHFNKYKNEFINTSVVLSILIGILVNSIVIDTIHWRHLWFFIGIGLSIITKYKKYIVGEYYE